MAKWAKIICSGFIGGLLFAFAILRKWGSGLHGDGSGDGEVRDGIQRASDGERRAEDRLERVEAELRGSEDIIGRVEARVERSEQLIDEGSNIIRRIRERNNENPLEGSD
jgi:hypothetical protein